MLAAAVLALLVARPAHFDLVVGRTRLAHDGWITELYKCRGGAWQLVWEQAAAIPNRPNLLVNALKRKR